MTNKIPKKIHFIWLGEEIPAQYVINISNVMAVAIPNGYNVTLWTDNPTKQLRAIQKITEKNDPLLKIKNIQLIYPHIKEYFSYYVKVHHGDPTEPLLKISYDKKKTDTLKKESKSKEIDVLLSEFILSAIAQETNGFHNYAATSDILRKMILFIYGGIYLDTDTTVEQKLHTYPLPMQDILLKYDAAINASPFMVNGNFDFRYCMNDILVSMPQSEIIRHMVHAWLHISNQQANLELPGFKKKSDYKIKKEKKYFTSAKDQRRFGYHGSEYLPGMCARFKRFLTIDLGPGAVAAGLKDWEVEHPVKQTFKAYCSLFIGYLNQSHTPFYKNSISSLGGIKFKSNSDQTWLKNDANGPQKPRRNEC